MHQIGKSAAILRALGTLALAAGTTAQTCNMSAEEIAERDRAEGRGVSRQVKRRQDRLAQKGRLE